MTASATLFDVDAHGAPIDVNASGLVGRDHPDTSKRAATSVRAGSQELLLLRLVAGQDERGVTCDEAQPAMSTGRAVPMSPNQVGARMLRLREKHLVGSNGDTRPTRTGRDASVHRVTEAGRIELARQHVQPIRNLADQTPTRHVVHSEAAVGAWYCEWCDQWGSVMDESEFPEPGVHECRTRVSVFVAATLEVP